MDGLNHHYYAKENKRAVLRELKFEKGKINFYNFLEKWEGFCCEIPESSNDFFVFTVEMTKILKFSGE